MFPSLVRRIHVFERGGFELGVFRVAHLACILDRVAQDGGQLTVSSFTL